MLHLSRFPICRPQFDLTSTAPFHSPPFPPPPFPSLFQIHRLPVVDESDIVVGILTRTDIYEPLMPSVNPVLHRVAGMK